MYFPVRPRVAKTSESEEEKHRAELVYVGANGGMAAATGVMMQMNAEADRQQRQN